MGNIIIMNFINMVIKQRLVYILCGIKEYLKAIEPKDMCHTIAFW